MKADPQPHDWDYTTRLCRRCERSFEWAFGDPVVRGACDPADVEALGKARVLARAISRSR